MSNLTPKEIMRLRMRKNKHTTALVDIENPLDREIRDLENIIQLYTKYPFIPFFKNGDATLAFYEKMRKLSPTHASIISKMIRFVTGGGMTVVKKQEAGFAEHDDEDNEVTTEQRQDYIDFIKSWINPATLLKDMARGYDGYKTWGNTFIEVVMSTVAGERVAQIYTHDADRCRYLITKKGQEKMVGISPEWTLEYLSKYMPQIVPVYPAKQEYEDGTIRTIIHLKNPSIAREWYGDPDSVASVFFQYLEYQLGNYTTDGYNGRWIAQVFLETFGDDEDNNDNEAFDLALIDTFTQKGKNRKRVLHRNAPEDAKETKVHEFAPKTDEKFHAEMSSIAETQILKAHNWNHLLLGVKISGSLGNGTEYNEVYKTTYFDKIQPEMQILLEPYRLAIKIVEEWLGYENPEMLTIGLQDIYHQMTSETQDNGN